MDIAMTRRRQCLYERGITLLELLVVIVIASVVMSIAVPAVGDWVRRQQVRTASFDVYLALMLARSEAISRNASTGNRVEIQPVGPCDADSCNWGTGWSIRQGAFEIQGHDSFAPALIMDGPLPIGFDRTGRAIFSAGSVTGVDISSANTTVVRCVTLDTIGRAATTTASCP